ncbi:MAG TPA: hypothetical protein VL854_06780 [Nitrososphaeraceae archaeon]|nr:hypothetical protein [Nitrososphaeraceae archaeon]
MFTELYYKFGDVDISLRNMEGRVDFVRDHKLINRRYMSYDDFDELIKLYNCLFGNWYRAIGEDLPEVIWNGK